MAREHCDAIQKDQIQGELMSCVREEKGEKRERERIDERHEFDGEGKFLLETYSKVDFVTTQRVQEGRGEKFEKEKNCNCSGE